MTSINVEQLKIKMDKNEDFVLLDVREAYEYEEFNIGGISIPLADIVSRQEEIQDFKLKEIIVYCQSGNRSLMAQQLLSQIGFENVINLEGGMLAWLEMNKAV